jgi:hypothetical protein
VAAREDHVPPLEDLFPAMVVRASPETPSTVDQPSYMCYWINLVRIWAWLPLYSP